MENLEIKPEQGQVDDFCGLCGNSGKNTWTVETPEDFGWYCDQNCKKHIYCSNCGYAL